MYTYCTSLEIKYTVQKNKVYTTMHTKGPMRYSDEEKKNQRNKATKTEE